MGNRFAKPGLRAEMSQDQRDVRPLRDSTGQRPSDTGQQIQNEDPEATKSYSGAQRGAEAKSYSGPQCGARSLTQYETI